MEVKAQYKDLVKKLRKLGGLEFGDDAFDDEMAKRMGDFVAPLLSLDVRTAVLTAYLGQLKQLVRDGIDGGAPAVSLDISIICHSFGCLHTYEALHAAVREDGLKPSTNGVSFANVVFMASPVQLVRSVAGRLGPLVPSPGDLATLSGSDLTQPYEMTSDGKQMSVRNWVSITGNLDFVGGCVLGKKLKWAHMALEGVDTRIDDQLGDLDLSKDSVVDAVVEAFAGGPSAGGGLALPDPHSWPDYIERHAPDLERWLLT
jgi:hypothetical protein